jgi:hypothetical protein
MKFRTIIAAALALALSIGQALAQATILPPGEACFQATTGVNGMVGVLGGITGGNSYSNGTYGGVALTGGSGTGATANITVSGGLVTQVTVLNPGIAYVVGDVLSAAAASIGGSGSGFSVPVASTSINSSLAGGTVGFYIPSTQTVKQTWQDAGQSILNQNPVPLDQNGCAVIYGAGIYRQVLKDSLGNTVWDKLTASTSPVGVFWAGLAAGTGNAITITDSAFALQDGATIQFLAAAANNGPATITISGGAPIAIINDTSSGPAALSGGEIGPGNTPMITYDAANFEFHLINPATTTSSSGGSSSLTPPQGYLNLVGQSSGDVIQTGDVVGAVTVYYSPFNGNTLPIWNGSVFKTVTFSELTSTLTAAGSASNSIQDSCVFSNNGVPTLVTGPAWTAPSPGNRGSGAGTAQITRLQGIWVNAVTTIGYNGLSSFTIPANQCTIVGSLSIDASAGQVSAYLSYGQARKFGVWNFYNRQQITLKAGDPTSSWSYPTNAIRAANGNSNNSIQIFSGLPEEPFDLQTTASVTGALINNQNIAGQIGIGVNSTTVFSGKVGQSSLTNSSGGQINGLVFPMDARFLAPPALGRNDVRALENGLGSTVSIWLGTESYMLLSAQWRG